MARLRKGGIDSVWMKVDEVTVLLRIFERVDVIWIKISWQRGAAVHGRGRRRARSEVCQGLAFDKTMRAPHFVFAASTPLMTATALSTSNDERIREHWI